MKLSKQENQLIYFLQEELAIPNSAISMVLRYQERNSAPLSMLLWQYGLVSLSQLEKILIWMENSVEVV